jgi:hypothetical protein
MRHPQRVRSISKSYFFIPSKRVPSIRHGNAGRSVNPEVTSIDRLSQTDRLAGRKSFALDLARRIKPNKKNILEIEYLIGTERAPGIATRAAPFASLRHIDDKDNENEND